MSNPENIKSKGVCTIMLWDKWLISDLPRCVLNGDCINVERWIDFNGQEEDVTFKQTWWKCSKCNYSFEEVFHTATVHDLICPKCKTIL